MGATRLKVKWIRDVEGQWNCNQSRRSTRDAMAIVHEPKTCLNDGTGSDTIPSRSDLPCHDGRMQNFHHFRAGVILCKSANIPAGECTE